MHVFLSPILNSKTSDPPTVQTFYEACIVAYLSITFHILWLKTLFGSGAQIVAKSKCPMQEILHWTRSVFFSLHVLLQDPIRSYKCFCCPPHKDERGVGETQSPCNQNNKSDNCCWCFLTVSWNMRC